MWTRNLHNENVYWQNWKLTQTGMDKQYGTQKYTAKHTNWSNVQVIIFIYEMKLYIYDNAQWNTCCKHLRSVSNLQRLTYSKTKSSNRLGVLRERWGRVWTTVELSVADVSISIEGMSVSRLSGITSERSRSRSRVSAPPTGCVSIGGICACSGGPSASCRHHENQKSRINHA